MRRRVQILVYLLVFFSNKFGAAQNVLYSPYINDAFNVIGKSDNYYWIEKKETKRKGKKHADVLTRSFEVYNTRMNLVNIVSPPESSQTLLKEYFLGNPDYFDQLLFVPEYRTTAVFLNRFTPDGNLLDADTMILRLPFSEDGNSFLLVRSEDKNKVLLLCFESMPGVGMRMHAVLFDRKWRQLSYVIYNHRNIVQPLIQDDFTSFPIEYFNNTPVQLANNGQWLMATPSRIDNNFLLYHFNGKDTNYICTEIKLPASSNWEDVSLSVDNDNGEVYGGVLSNFHFSALKNVEVIHYSLNTHRFDFDSSYRFNTLMAYRIINENLTHESFIMVPGAGFMLLKEYGRPYSTDFEDNNEYIDPGGLRSVFTDNAIVNTNAPLMINKDGYTRYDKLSGPRGLYNRGDLSLFYFPAHNADSCWSGIIDKEQTTEFNSPYLSYLVVPVNQKIFFLYNSFFRSSDEEQYGNTTILDYRGNLLIEEGLVYWKLSNTLNFQQSHQISNNEVAIPYENLKRKGFAIIRF